MIWNESIECMDRESLRKIQGIVLKRQWSVCIMTLLSIAGKCRNWALPPMTSTASMIS